MTDGQAAGDAAGVMDTIAPPSTESFLWPCSVKKLLILSITTFNLYFIYWFWRQWRREEPDDSILWTLFRVVLAGLFFYPLARSVEDEADKHGIPFPTSPAVLTVALFLTVLGLRFIENEWVLALVPFHAGILVPVQRTINKVNAIVAPAAGTKERFTRWEIVVAALGGFLWALILLGIMLGEPVPPTDEDTLNV